MTTKNIIRAWKDPMFRNSLTEVERAALPANPAGAVEISDAALGKVAGGAKSTDSDFCTIVCPTHFMCSLNKCSQLGCPSAIPYCTVAKL